MSSSLEKIHKVWKLIVRSEYKGIPLSDIVKESQLDEDEVHTIIELLHSLYLIEYPPTNGANDIIVRQRYVLGNPLDNIPCLGCPSIRDCNIGNLGISPESCHKFLQWLFSLHKD